MASTSLGMGPIGQISRTVSDIAAAEAWYGGVLGLPHLFTFGKLAFFDCGGTRLYLSAERETPQTEESVLYFRVADIAKAHADLVARGVEFRGAPHMIYRHPDGTEEVLVTVKAGDRVMEALAILETNDADTGMGRAP